MYARQCTDQIHSVHPPNTHFHAHRKNYMYVISHPSTPLAWFYRMRQKAYKQFSIVWPAQPIIYLLRVYCDSEYTCIEKMCNAIPFLVAFVCVAPLTVAHPPHESFFAIDISIIRVQMLLIKQTPTFFSLILSDDWPNRCLPHVSSYRTWFSSLFFSIFDNLMIRMHEKWKIWFLAERGTRFECGRMEHGPQQIVNKQHQPFLR